MLRRLRTQAVMPAGRMAGAVAASFSSQCLGEFLKRLERIDTHPAVLDLGVLCGDNIAFLGARGCRVSVESLPAAGRFSPAADSADAVDAPLSPLSCPPASFSGVLAWDAISRMPQQEAIAFVETLRRLLLDGGVILSYFPGPPEHTHGSGRYRIMADSWLTVEPTGGRQFAPRTFQNREIYALFSRFEVVRLSHLKSGTREVLVAKSRRSARGA